MNYQQMMDYSLKDRGWSYQVSFTRSTCNVYTKAISLQTRYRRMPREHMYWIGINADIEDYTKRCQECIKRSQTAKEPLQPHDIPEGPWRKLGMDYFHFNGNTYVLICDYFSKFPFHVQSENFILVIKGLSNRVCFQLKVIQMR